MRYDCKSTDGCHAEYAVDMPSMKSCLENAKIVTEQSEMVEAICIPQADKSSKVKKCSPCLVTWLKGFKRMNWERLRENAEAALNNCIQTKSEWGIQYWSNVLAYLLRQSGRMH